MSKLKLDLHDIFNNTKAIDSSLEALFQEAIDKRIQTIEIIPGKGSGQLKKRVLRFVEQKHIKENINRIEKDSKNFGRLFIYLRPFKNV